MGLAGNFVKQIMEELCIETKLQLIPWMRWYKNGEMHRFHQPIGKQYTFGKGTEYDSEETRLQVENHYLKQRIVVLKKYAELERK